MGALLTDLEEIQKPLFELQGLLQGIAADGLILEPEITRLRLWLDRHEFLKKIPMVKKISGLLDSSSLRQENYEALLEICTRPLLPPASVSVAVSLKELFGILNGISSDGQISPQEIVYLKKWTRTYSYLCGRWPYDDVIEFIVAFENNNSKELCDEFLEFCSIFR